MPKVSDAHRAARRDQILRAALRCVAAEGFHKTTMASVIAESGLSAGAVYLYFRSKNDLIRAIAETGVSRVPDVIAACTDVEDVPPPEVVMAQVTAEILAAGEQLGVPFPNLVVQGWAEAARDPSVLEVIRSEATRIRSAWVRYAARAVAAGHVPPDADPEQVGVALMGLMPGFIVLQIAFGGVTPEHYAAGVAALCGRSLPQPS